MSSSFHKHFVFWLIVLFVGFHSISQHVYAQPEYSNMGEFYADGYFEDQLDLDDTSAFKQVDLKITIQKQRIGVYTLEENQKIISITKSPKGLTFGGFEKEYYKWLTQGGRIYFYPKNDYWLLIIYLEYEELKLPKKYFVFRIIEDFEEYENRNF